MKSSPSMVCVWGTERNRERQKERGGGIDLILRIMLGNRYCHGHTFQVMHPRYRGKVIWPNGMVRQQQKCYWTQDSSILEHISNFHRLDLHFEILLCLSFAWLKSWRQTNR